jgi:hypothetical protein
MDLDTVLQMGKLLVERGDLSGLQQAIMEIRGGEEDVGSLDLPTLFQKVYLHACLKGQRGIVEWLQNFVFPTLDPIQQIALRQGFAYGRYLLGVAERRTRSD